MQPVIFTVDLDRDWPVESSGRMESRSGASPDEPDDPHISATLRGVQALLDIAETLSVTFTFFAEASVLKKIKIIDPDIINRLRKHEVGSHGYAHEDFTGEGSGYIPTEEEMICSLRNSYSTISSILSPPIGFRAPYLRFEHFNILPEIGFQYDSSITLRESSLEYSPSLPLEVYPLINGRDPENKVISGYLWQLMEGRRKVKQYHYLIDQQSRLPYSMLAIHPWHLYFSVESGYLSEKISERNVRNVKLLLESLKNPIISIQSFRTK